MVPTLLDLPVLPEDRDEACETHVILDAYTSECKAIKTVDDLTNFVNRWSNMWRLTNEHFHPVTSSIENDIVNLNFDKEKVLGFVIRVGERDDNLDFDDVNVSIACTIVAPVQSIMAFLLAKKFGVDTDLGFVRLYLDPYPELIDKLRC
jgi:hypothetical protein